MVILVTCWTAFLDDFNQNERRSIKDPLRSRSMVNLKADKANFNFKPLPKAFKSQKPFKLSSSNCNNSDTRSFSLEKNGHRLRNR